MMDCSWFTGDGKIGLGPGRLPPASEKAGQMGNKDPQVQPAVPCQRLCQSRQRGKCLGDTLSFSWIGQFPALAVPPGGPAVVIGSRFAGDAEGAAHGKDNPEETVPFDGVSLWEARLEQAAEVSLCSRGCPRPTEGFFHHRWPLVKLHLIASACQEVDCHVTDCVTITKCCCVNRCHILTE